MKITGNNRKWRLTLECLALALVCVLWLYLSRPAPEVFLSKYKSYVPKRLSLNANDLYFWVAGDSDKISPGDPMQARNYFWDSSISTVEIHGARGEVVAFQIVLCAGKKTQLKDIECGNFINEKGQSANVKISLFRELYIKMRGRNMFGAFGEGEYPDALIPFYDPYSSDNKKVAIPFDMEPGMNQTVWVDVCIPLQTESSNYTSRFTIKLADDKVFDLKVNLKVWDFEIPNESHLAAFSDLYGNRFEQGEGVKWELSENTWEVLGQYESMAAEHRFVNGHWGLEPSVKFDATGNLQEIDWSKYDKYFGAVLEGKSTGRRPACWSAPFKENWLINPQGVQLKMIESYSREVEKHLLVNKWLAPQTFAYVFDEPAQTTFPAINRWGEAFHKGTNKLKLFVTTYPVKELTQADIWAAFGSEYYPPLHDQYRKLGQAGWFYQAETEPFLPVESIDTYGAAFRIWSWIAWKYRADGIFLWASNYWKNNPYEDLDASYGDGEGLLFYPGRKLELLGLPAIKGPASSFRMKALRRGLQDYEYFWLLKSKGSSEQADAAVNKLVRSALAVKCDYAPPYHYEGRNFGRSGPSKFPNRFEDQRKEGQWSKDPKDYYQIRRTLAEILTNN